MALLIPIIVILIGATISFGLFFFQANVLQQAVDVGAQEIARMPFKPTAELGLNDFSGDPSKLLWQPDEDSDGGRLRTQIYHPKHLVIRRSDYQSLDSDPDMALRKFVADMPLLNRLLFPTMIQDVSFDPEGTGGVIRYPGAIVTFSDPDDGQTEETVLIPIVNYAANGSETLFTWLTPVEEIEASDGAHPFSLGASSSSGLVALRINYPAQSTTLVNRVGDEGQVIIDADDSSLGDGDTGSAYSLAVGNESGAADTQIYSGRYGLGRQAALLREAGVRPYRKVLSVQAIYRREVFQ